MGNGPFQGDAAPRSAEEERIIEVVRQAVAAGVAEGIARGITNVLDGLFKDVSGGTEGPDRRNPPDPENKG